MTMGLHETTPAGLSKKLTRSRGRAKKPVDPYESAYGVVPFNKFGGRQWIPVHELNESMVGKRVQVFGAVRYIRPQGKTRAILVLLDFCSTVPCVIDADSDDKGVTTRMVRFAVTQRHETPIDVEGVVVLRKSPLATTQKVEIMVSKIHSIAVGPMASRDRTFKSSSTGITPRPASAVGRGVGFQKAGQAGRDLTYIYQDASLNHGSTSIKLCSLAHHAIFRIQSEVEFKIMGFLRSKHFVGIHTQSMFFGSTEGASSVLKPDDISSEIACLAQSPWIYLEMITSEAKRVFEVGSVFRLEKSKCELHTCKFIDFSAEMEIKEHYFEVCDIINALLVELFRHLNESCKKELETINRQHPFEPLKYLERTLMLKHEDGVQMLKEAGMKVTPMCDITTEHEKKLGLLVREKYNTDLFILYRHPLALRPLYTMPCAENPAYGNSFDVFIRGEQVISGSQRIHNHEVLMKRAAEFGIDMNHAMKYLDLFRYGLPQHGGFGACLYRVVMLFCGLDHF